MNVRLGTVRTSSTLRSACSSFRIHNPLRRTLPIRPPPPRLPHLSDRASVAPSGRPPAIIASRKAPYSPNRRTAVLRRGASGIRPPFNRPTDRSKYVMRHSVRPCERSPDHFPARDAPVKESRIPSSGRRRYGTHRKHDHANESSPQYRTESCRPVHESIGAPTSSSVASSLKNTGRSPSLQQAIATPGWRIQSL